MKRKRNLVFVMAVAMLVATSGLVAYPSFWSRPHTELLSRNVLRTSASPADVTSAINRVYRELRLEHYQSESGEIRFDDGTSRDRTSNESVSRTGDFVQGQRTFDDPEGRPIRICWYREPGLGTLIVWEYADPDDDQQIATILQVAIRQRMTIR